MYIGARESERVGRSEELRGGQRGSKGDAGRGGSVCIGAIAGREDVEAGRVGRGPRGSRERRRGGMDTRGEETAYVAWDGEGAGREVGGDRRGRAGRGREEGGREGGRRREGLGRREEEEKERGGVREEGDRDARARWEGRERRCIGIRKGMGARAHACACVHACARACVGERWRACTRGEKGPPLLSSTLLPLPLGKRAAARYTCERLCTQAWERWRACTHPRARVCTRVHARACA